MEATARVNILENLYVGVLADAVRQLTKAGILEQVTAEKRIEQMAVGSQKAAQFGISEPQQVFLKLSELINCTSWKINPEESGFSAEAETCKLWAMTKRIGGGQPCQLYCLDPMEGMVRGLVPGCQYRVRETLWEGRKCRVEVELPFKG